VNYWQIATGSDGRDYSKEFLRFGMAFVGNGGKEGARMKNEVQLGDIILVRHGLSKVVAVGKVVKREEKFKGNDDKDWLKDFDGWDLSAYCYVDWHIPQNPDDKVDGLSPGTIKKVDQKNLRDFMEDIIQKYPSVAKFEPEPAQTKEVNDEEILDFLICEGLRPGTAEELTVTLNRIRLLANYYRKHQEWEDVREHETRTFLIVPLLLALGWAEQQIKVELSIDKRRRVDLACFSSPYCRKNEQCVLLIESKGFSQGLTYAPDQASEYAKNFPNCKVVLVSNGYCYKAFGLKKGEQFPSNPSAYLNLLCPRDRYPIDPDHVKGCCETLKMLLPTYKG